MYTAQFLRRLLVALTGSVVPLLGLNSSALSQSDWLDNAFKKQSKSSSQTPSRRAHDKPREQRWCEQSYKTFAASLINSGYQFWDCTPQGWVTLTGASACATFHPTYGFAIWMNREPDTIETISLHRLIPKRTHIENEKQANVRLVVDKTVLQTETTQIYLEPSELPAYRTLVYAPSNAWQEISEGNELWVGISDGNDIDVWQFTLQGSRLAVETTRACLAGT